jgi:Na+/melibiose symporter-like transporter
LTQELSKSTIYAHGSLGLPLAVIGYPLAIWIPAHYSGGLGISLAAVGTILMLARLTDVVTDPVMGELSDRWRTRIGRRRPWLLIGAPVMMFGVYKLFIPEEGVGLVYFLVWLSIFFLGSTMIGLPHRAWGAELSPDYHQRSRVTAAREIYVLVGLMVAAAVPMIVEIRADGGASVGEVFTTLWSDAIGAFSGDFREKTIVDRATLTGPVLAGLAWAIILILPLCTAVVLTLVREPEAVPNERRPSFIEGLRLVTKNGPMLRVPLIALLVTFAESGLGAIPFWLWLGRTIGKHRAFMCTLITVACVSGANLLLDYGDYLPFFLLFVIKGFCFGGLQFLPVAMLADVVDVDAARTGGRRAGTYFAFLGFTEKIAIAFGTGVSLNIVGLLGFDPSGGVAASTDIGVLSLRLVYCLGPIVFYGLALKLIWNYPLTPARHARLRGALERRTARLAAAEAMAREP